MASPLGPVIYSIYVNGVVDNNFPLDVELQQCWGKHDMFCIRIEYPRTFTGVNILQLWPDNAPVQIIWGRRPDNIQTWYGYVNHKNIKGNADSGSKALQVTYFLLGTSKPMNTDKTRTWGQVTPTYIARKIASEYSMRAILTSTSWVLPYEVQTNESDFKFLNRMADKTGFRFWASNGTLYFIDPTVVLQNNVQQGTPTYYLDKRFTNLDTIREFDMNKGDNLPGGTKTTRTMFGVDPTSGQVLQITADTDQVTDVSQISKDWPIENYSTGKNLVNAWQSRSQFWLSATAELYGNAYLYPGKMIYLQGLQLPNDAQGYWIVASANHILKASGTSVASSDKFVTRVELLKNESSIIPKLKATTKISPEFVNCQLFNNGWRSNNLSVYYDGVSNI